MRIDRIKRMTGEGQSKEAFQVNKRDTKWDLPVASAIFITHSLTLSSAHTFVGIVGTSTMCTVGVVAAAGSIEITNVAVFDCRTKTNLTFLSSVAIGARAFVSIFHA